MRWFRKKKTTEAKPADSVCCPRCGLINPHSSLWCDCGHVFDVQRAREVIEEENHAHVDRPLGGILFCPLCSRLSPGETQLCFCGYRFRAPPSDTDAVPVKCPLCDARLWLQPPIDGAHFTCPNCSKAFSTTVSEDGDVHIEIVDFLTNLEACYAALGVPVSATKDEIKNAYELRIAEYDLTDLPQIAAELHDLATARQRQIRAAYATLARMSAEAS